MMLENIIVSVVMPVYNEEKYIKKCIDSLLLQSFPKEKMEWIFVDGCSNDRTVQIIKQYSEQYPELVKVYSNEQRIVPYAMNIGIRNSSGKYIVRLDAHADYSPNYIEKCVYYLENTDAENVGGVAETKSFGFVGNAIAKMLSSRFGVGNSQFRINGESGYVDTVPFGAFRRDVFSKYGGYDERLVRNQDNEMNYRIRKNGGKIYLANDIKLSYYCRDNILGISDMAYKNGRWNIITMKLCPGSMGVRHFVPFAFVLSIICFICLMLLFPVTAFLFTLEMLLYFSLDVFFAFKISSSIKEMLLLILLFPIFHISYGLGSFRGLLDLQRDEFKNKDYCPKKI